MNLNEMISKSLDEIDAMTAKFSKPEVATNDISKSQGNEDVAPEEVSDDVPEENEEAPEQEGNEGAPEAQEDNEEDVDEDEEGEQDSEEDDVDKSLEKDMKSNDSVRKALEVSEFLDNLVKSISTHIATHNDGLSKSLEATNQSTELLAKSLLGITKAQRAVLEGQAEMHKSIRTLNKRLKTIEEQPQVRKSVASAQAINKSFEASAGNKPKQPTLNKSQISAKLTDAMLAGNKDLLNDVLAYDSTGRIETLSTEAKNILGL